MENCIQQATEVLELEITALQNLLPRLGTAFEQSIEALKNALERGKKIIVVGVGKSEAIGIKLAATLTSTGAPAVTLSTQNALHGDLGLITNGDPIICLSYSGETQELLSLLPHLRQHQSTLIALTGNLNSTLAQHSDLLLDTSVQREACPLNLAPTSSTTAMLAMGDALAMVLLQARGFTEQDFAKYHPGGTLGRHLLTKISDIMRRGHQLAITSPSQTINHALQLMSHARSGACIIQNNDLTLAGILTHGDFVRAFQANPQIGHHPISQHMTTNPITISADALAVEASHLIAEKKIDDLIALNHQGHPVGIIDSQDLARLKLL